MQLRAVLNEPLGRMSSKARVEVLVTDVSVELLRLLVSQIDRHSTQEELQVAVDIVHKQAGRQKPDVDALVQALRPLFTSAGAASVLVLWTRLDESFYKVIV